MKPELRNKGIAKTVKKPAAMKWALSYGLVVLLTVSAICFVLIVYGMNYVAAESRKNLKSSSEKVAANIDQRFEYIKQSAVRIATSDWASYISSASGINESIERLYGITPEFICFQINSYCNAERIIKNITVFFPYSGIIYNRSSDYREDTYFNSRDAYDRAFYDDIKSLVRTNKYFEYRSVERDGRQAAVILYNHTEKGLVVVMEVDSGQFLDFVGSLVYDNSFDFYLTLNGTMLADNDEQVLKGITGGSVSEDGYREFSANGRDLVSVAVKSRGTDFAYNFVFDEDYASSNEKVIKGFIFLGAALSVVVGVLLSVLFVFINYKPLKSMLDIAKEVTNDNRDASGDEYGYLKQTFRHLGEEVNRYREESLRYQKAVWNRLLVSIITGNFTLTRDNMKLLYDNDFVDDSADSYTVILFGAIDSVKFAQLCEKEGITSLTEYFYGAVAECMEEKSRLSLWQSAVNIRDNIYAVVLKSNGGNGTQDAHLVAGKLRKMLTERFDGSLAVAEGDARPGISGIAKSYQIADKLLNWQRFTGNVSFEDVERLKKSSSHYYLYPRDWEVRLSNELYKGNAETVNAILDEIIKENWENRELTPDMKINLINRLIETARIVLSKMNEEAFESLDRFEQELPNMNESQLLNELRDLFKKICLKGYENQLKASENKLYNKIIEYIKLNCTDRNLSLKGISAEFSVPEYTVSKIFKRITGVNFLDYVNQERIEKAKELLLNTDTVVYEIAALTGFDNDRSFRRVFKKYTGTGPMEYRQAYRADGAQQ